MKTSKSFGVDTPSLAEIIRKQIKEGLYDLSPPSEALSIQLYQALKDEHRFAIDSKQHEREELARNILTNAHLILSLKHQETFNANSVAPASPQTIRALLTQRDIQE